MGGLSAKLHHIPQNSWLKAEHCKAFPAGHQQDE
jgi:hypothetical protein